MHAVCACTRQQLCNSATSTELENQPHSHGVDTESARTLRPTATAANLAAALTARPGLPAGRPPCPGACPPWRRSQEHSSSAPGVANTPTDLLQSTRRAHRLSHDGCAPPTRRPASSHAAAPANRAMIRHLVISHGGSEPKPCGGLDTPAANTYVSRNRGLRVSAAVTRTGPPGRRAREKHPTAARNRRRCMPRGKPAPRSGPPQTGTAPLPAARAPQEPPPAR